MASFKVLVPIATGSEDIESSSVIDICRRCPQISVVVAAAGSSREVTLARGLRVTADALLTELASDTVFDLIALPGGMPGATNLRDDATLRGLLSAQKASGRWVAAMCASPAVVLAGIDGLLDGVTMATCHTNFADTLKSRGVYTDARVAVDEVGKVITSAGPGTSIEWGLACVAALAGKEAAAAVAKPLHLHPAALEALGL